MKIERKGSEMVCQDSRIWGFIVCLVATIGFASCKPSDSSSEVSEYSPRMKKFEANFNGSIHIPIHALSSLKFTFSNSTNSTDGLDGNRYSNHSPNWWVYPPAGNFGESDSQQSDSTGYSASASNSPSYETDQIQNGQVQNVVISSPVPNTQYQSLPTQQNPEEIRRIESQNSVLRSEVGSFFSKQIKNFKYDKEGEKLLNSKVALAVQEQFLFSKNTLEGDFGLFITNDKLELKVKSINLPDGNYIGKKGSVLRIDYEAKISMWDKSKNADDSLREIVIPASLIAEDMQLALKDLEKCSMFEGDFVATAGIETAVHTDFSGCPFPEGSNAEKFFVRTKLTLQKSSPAPIAVESPEYNRIWSDGELVAMVIFGAYETSAGGDIGTDQFVKFVEKLSSESFLKSNNLENRTIVPLAKWRRLFQFNVKGSQKKLYIEAMRVEDITRISNNKNVLNNLFTPKMTRADLIIYNGHAGYGQKTSYLSNLIKVDPSHYTLYYLNGCWTYTVNEIESPNHDMIMNISPGFFSDYMNSSVSLISNLTKDSNYKDILLDLPERSNPIVVGEDIRSCEKITTIPVKISELLQCLQK